MRTQFADVVESADTLAWGASGSNIVQVQVLSSAPKGLVQSDGTFYFVCETFFHRGIFPLHDDFSYRQGCKKNSVTPLDETATCLAAWLV